MSQFLYFLLFFLLFSFSILNVNNSISSDLEYIVLIDCGSSGSRIHIYSYQLTPFIPIINPSKSMKIRPGLHTFINNPIDGAQSLLPLLVFANKTLNIKQQINTPIYVYSTAGMRSIQLNKAELLLNAVREFIMENTIYIYNPANIDIINGTIEGINGWIASNYLMGNFHLPYNNNNNSNNNSIIFPTVGVLEMGGASFQITYSPTQQTINNHTNHPLINVNIGSLNYRVFTHSYMNYGLEHAQLLYLQRFPHLNIIDNSISSNSNNTGDPCYPRNISNKNGRGHYGECMAIVDSIIAYEYIESVNDEYSHYSCYSHNCSFGSIPIPPIDSFYDKFVAIENFFYTTEFFNLLNSTHFIDDLRIAGSNYCNLNWEEIIELYPNEPLGDLEKYCFSSAYLVRVLEIGLGYANETGIYTELSHPYINIQLTKYINGIQLDWALGAVIKLVMDDLHADLYHNNNNNNDTQIQTENMNTDESQVKTEL